MNQPAKAQEPSMEEILASIRRIIADEDTGKDTNKPAAPAAAAPPAPKPAPAPPPKPAAPPAAANNQNDIDAMLADLDAAPKAPPPKPVAAAPPPPKVEPPVADVLDLTEAMAAPAPGPAAAFRTIDAACDVFFAERAPDAPAEPMPRPVEEPRGAAAPFEPDRGLISTNTASAVDSAFNALAHTVLGNNARTLEDLVKEMLRPMLKSWLDDNLPNMVERIVRAEIERVSRGRS